MRALPVLIACCLLGGCVLNRSGTLRDDVDGGPMGLDAGPPGQDGAPPELDAGPIDVDAGPIGVDAGCPGSTTACGGSGCVNTETDPEHCGGCDERCSTPRDGTATCAGGACGFLCDPGFEPDGTTCREDRCGDGALDPGEACDDGNLVEGDGCGATCVMETDATSTCPGAEVWLSGPRQHYTGDTRGLSGVVRCPGTSVGADAIFTVHTLWSGFMRVHVRPIGSWDITLNTRPGCPLTLTSWICEDRRGPGSDEELSGDVSMDGRYSVVVSGFRGIDEGAFEIWFEAI